MTVSQVAKADFRLQRAGISLNFDSVLSVLIVFFLKFLIYY